VGGQEHHCVSGLLSGLWQKVAFAAAFIGLLLLAVLRLIGMERKQERAEATERVNQQAKEARNVENRVDGANAAELERMRRKWER